MPPAFLAALNALTDTKRKDLLEAKHDAYTEHVDAWRVLLDAYDGSGGFLSGAHLWRYAREESGAFTSRQEQARYHNYAETLVDLYARKIFAQTIDRDTTSAPLRAWWDDVDGRGTAIDTYMRDTLCLSLTLGHVGTLVDKTPDPPTGPALSDERARVVLARYLPTAIWDWRTVGEDLKVLKLREALEPADLVVADDAPEYALLIWAEDGWARILPDGTIERVSDDPWTLDVVPFVVCRPKRSHRWPFLGKSLFNAGILKALYNRASEEDEVLRDQAFSVLTVEVPPDGDVESVKKDLGTEIGTTRALVARGKVAYATPDMSAPETLRANQTYLVQEIYRLAHLRFERQSLQKESGEAIRLQFDELNEMLAGIAAECARVETEIAKLFFAWTTPTPEQARSAFDAADVQIHYPTEFFVGDMETDLKAWAQAASMGLGQTATVEIRKRVVSRVLPDLDDQTRDTVDAEIVAAVKQAEQQQAQMGAGALSAQLRTSAMQRLGGFMAKPDGPPAREGVQ